MLPFAVIAEARRFYHNRRRQFGKGFFDVGGFHYWAERGRCDAAAGDKNLLGDTVLTNTQCLCRWEQRYFVVLQLLQ